MAIEGPLKELGIHDVFQLLDLSQKTGTCGSAPSCGRTQGTVYFEQGSRGRGRDRQQSASARHHAASARARSAKADLMRARAMQQAGDPPAPGRDPGLAELAISERELTRQVRRQAEEVVFELMSWSEGYFSFQDGQVRGTGRSRR